MHDTSARERLKKAYGDIYKHTQNYLLWFVNADLDIESEDKIIQQFIANFRIGGARRSKKKELKIAQRELRYYFEKILVKKKTPTEKEIEFINAKRQSISRCIFLQPYRKRDTVRYIPRDYPYILNDDLALCYDLLVHDWINAQAIKKCRECNLFFEPNKYNLNKQIFCSSRCSRKFHSRKHREKDPMKYRKQQREYMREYRKI